MTEVVIVGCGEVGVAYAEGVRGLDPAPTVHLMDPKPGPAGLAFAESADLAIHRDAGPWLAAADVVLLATPGGLLERVLDSLLPHLSADVAIADMSTASAEAKQAAAVRCGQQGVDYVDVAITGSVALSKAGTPLLYAGPEVPALLALFTQLDAPLTVLEGSRPGDAMRVKLLRSVVMKGLEGLVVECLPAAQEYGVLDQLWASLGDVDRTGFVALLQAMTRTHPRHAARREHEVADAAAQLEAVGYPSGMTRATEQRFAATNAATTRAGWPEHDTTDGAIAWLRSLQQAPVTTDQDVLARLAELGAATVYEANGQTGAFDAGLKPLDPSRTLVGRAVTLDLPPADNWYIHVAMLKAGPGDVLVVDAKGYLEAGPWGDVLTCLAQERGLAGLVIDGAVRDSRDIVASGFPVFARGLSIKGTTKAVPGRVNVPVRVGGVTVEPGDIIIGDADGLVRVPAHQLHDALAASEARAAKEAGFRDRIRAGANTLELLGLTDPRTAGH